jgi:hypothetical protein
MSENSQRTRASIDKNKFISRQSEKETADEVKEEINAIDKIMSKSKQKKTPDPKMSGNSQRTRASIDKNEFISRQSEKETADEVKEEINAID